MNTAIDAKFRAFFHEKKILITGATGTLGQALVCKLGDYAPAIIRLFSRDEHKQFLLSRALSSDAKYRLLIGDVRNYDRLLRATEGIDIVLHTAAMKHVPICEYNPFEAVQTNVIGTQNVIMACLENKVKHLLVTSSDKAVSPPNTMGATKLLAERLVTSAAYAKGSAPTIFCTVRFGNVIGSRGSVIHTFLDLLKQSRPLPVTHPDMTRFMMSIDQAVSLVLKALLLAQGGDVFVLKMPVIRLGDLVQVLMENYLADSGNAMNPLPQIDIIGKRPGEKMYEELMSEEEGIMALERKDMFILPPWWRQNPSYPETVKSGNPLYVSKHILPVGKEKIRNMLIASGIFRT